VTLGGDIEEAASNLRRAYYFALLSIRTERERHELAFEKWIDGAGIREAAKEANVAFHNNKAEWASRTESNVDWEDLAYRVRDHVASESLVDLISMEDELTGVSYNKWGFTVAMSGAWEVVCVDSNVKNYLGMDGRLDLRTKDGIDRYFALVNKIKEQVMERVPPFLAQWSIYDMMRGEHQRHEPYFQHAYPFLNG
jgi:hypothetical protein